MPVAFLKPDEQLKIESPSSIRVVNGPAIVTYLPLVERGIKRKAIQLGEKEYATFKDTMTGEETVVAGPTLHFMDPYDVHENTRPKLILTDRQYCRLLDTKSGKQRLVRGPATVVPEPLETCDEGVQGAIELEEMDYLVVSDRLTGALRIEAGPQLLFPGVHDVSEGKQKKMPLLKNQFAKVYDTASGEIRVVAGPQVLVPAKATEHLGPIEAAYELLNNQYVKLLDKATGMLRVERGEKIVVPGPNENAVGTVQDAVDVDDETAVLVVSKESGQQRLVTEKGLFFPGKYDEIIEVRKLVRVAPHEVAIARDNDGAYHFYAGSGSNDTKGTAFFLQPHHEQVTMMWSSGTSPEDLEKNVVRNAKQVQSRSDPKPRLSAVASTDDAFDLLSGRWPSRCPSARSTCARSTPSSSTRCAPRTTSSSCSRAPSSGRCATQARRCTQRAWARTRTHPVNLHPDRRRGACWRSPLAGDRRGQDDRADGRPEGRRVVPRALVAHPGRLARHARDLHGVVQLDCARGGLHGRELLQGARRAAAQP